VELNDWILALHLLSAFAMVSAAVLFWILIVVSQRMDTPAATLQLSPVARVGGAVVAAGSVGTIVFGVWLAISLEAYQVWDGWVIAAIVLWAIAGEAGRRTGLVYTAAMNCAEELHTAGSTGPSEELLALNRTRAGILLHALTTLALLLLLLDMIWKPGA
jgi:hypothetical protein